MAQSVTRAVVTGGAGFIGSHLVDRLLAAGHAVTVLDNLSSGREEFVAHHRDSRLFQFIKLDIRDTTRLKTALDPKTDIVFHLAANADIARGVADPSLDFEHSIVATYSLLEAMRTHGIGKLVYTSGSGVYGDRGRNYSSEATGPLVPVSMYGATKLGAEGMISAYTHLFGSQAWIVRPANIIGPRATHGVVFDFVHKLLADPTTLYILGDGQQSKSYVHVYDVLDAIELVQQEAQERVNIFNVASNSFISVNEIADVVIRALRLKRVKVVHSGGTIGWPGDVATVRLRSTRLKRLGWRPNFTARRAVEETIRAVLKETRIVPVQQHAHVAR